MKEIAVLVGSWTGPSLGQVTTLPNLITLVRTVASVAVAMVGIVSERPALLLVGYAIYWFGDIADGWFARVLNQETRLGAVFDIVSDRACTAILCGGLLTHVPAAAPTVIVFFLSFMVLDTLLSLAFLNWPILSPNYFAQVDPMVYRLNWSPPAKALNTAGVIVAVAFGWYALALTIAACVSLVKAWSGLRILGLLRGHA